MGGERWIILANQLSLSWNGMKFFVSQELKIKPLPAPYKFEYYYYIP
jgi:hypothetical protein